MPQRSIDFVGLRNRILNRLFPTSYFHNPWRRRYPRYPRPLSLIITPFVRLGVFCGFRNVDYAYVNGPRGRLHLGQGCSTTNVVFNTVSGHITIGADTVFSHECHVLTGTHRFWKGRRAGLQPDSPITEVPSEGRDVTIGAGCFFGAGVFVIGPVTIGDNVVVGAGAVVTHDIPPGCFASGVPASHRPLPQS
jgi:acetyltransferase-like isoleucine patch superfamily enzyme